MRRQVGIVLLTRLYSAATQVVLLVLLARLASLGSFGAISALTGALAFWFALADLGLSGTIARARALDDTALVGGGLRLNLVTTLSFGAVAAVFCGVVRPFDLGALDAIALVAAQALEKNTDTSLSVAYADKANRAAAVSVIGRRTTQLIVFVALAATDAEIVSAYVAAALLAALVGQAHIRRFLVGVVTDRGHRLSMPDARRILHGSFPFLLGSVTGQARTLDTAVVGASASAETAGHYSAAARVVGPVMIAASALSTALLPHSSRLDAAQARRIVMRLVVATGALTICTIPFAVLGEPIMTTVFGDEFEGTGGALTAALLFAPTIALSSPLGALLQGQRRERFVAGNGVLFAVVLIVATYVAAPHGATAAAVAVGATFTLKVASLGVVALRLTGPPC